MNGVVIEILTKALEKIKQKIQELSRVKLRSLLYNRAKSRKIKKVGGGRFVDSLDDVRKLMEDRKKSPVFRSTRRAEKHIPICYLLFSHCRWPKKSHCQPLLSYDRIFRNNNSPVNLTPKATDSPESLESNRSSNRIDPRLTSVNRSIFPRPYLFSVLVPLPPYGSNDSLYHQEGLHEIPAVTTEKRITPVFLLSHRPLVVSPDVLVGTDTSCYCSHSPIDI
ncbi:expressed unknown protein [Seminavis robusta]|uniref:Uncharacterized protein n=1 Tax=Seminavis robusta TaxID=568900 RepID=A0A9N8F4U6_9STRA|nr:expressed unknown protein [Seminavis robusta]|eukprot:Sro3740_g129351.1  (222) ;mRNA; f:1805-2470